MFEARAFLVVLIVSCVGLVPVEPGAAQERSSDAAGLSIRPEVTDWVETSRYEDVVAFLRAAAAASERVHLTTMGYTHEGRAIPMAVVGDVADASAEAVRASDRLRVYVQGNIHGGEVPGKEALLLLLRDVATGVHADWWDRLVLLLVPVYNADGNERIALTNRPRQHGPVGGMGQRSNAQGYDLNRDHMKLDAPETRSLAGMMTAYDPHVVVDLHTTNGTRHGYHLTYSPPLHPGTHPSVVGVLRRGLLPAVTRAVEEEHGAHFHYYGNRRPGPDAPGWYTFDHRPRFNNNYAGLRNRLGILSEAYAYLTFRERVEATLWFVEEILAYGHAHADELKDAVEDADAASIVGERLPTRAAHARSDTMVTILMGEVAEERHPYTGRVMLRRRDVVRPEEMWGYGTFRATDTEIAPSRYLIPAELEGVVERLGAHGVPLGTLEAERSMAVETFVLDSARTAERPFQGRHARTLFGRWRPETRTVDAGTRVVEVSDALGRLAFYLLEPRSDDGLATWGLLDEALEDADTYPILRVTPGG